MIRSLVSSSTVQVKIPRLIRARKELEPSDPDQADFYLVRNARSTLQRASLYYLEPYCNEMMVRVLRTANMPI